MAKKHSFTVRLLVPIMIVLMLFPPLSYLIFSQTANRYAVSSARRDLETLKERLIPLMDESFESSSEAARPREQVSAFLSEIGPLMANTGGGARLMILGTRMQVIYPRIEEVRKSVEPLSEAFSELAESSEQSGTATVDGETYLLEIYKTPETVPNVRYIITYCPASQVGEWVNGASLWVLAISAALAAAAFVILLFLTRRNARALRRLCREAERIGGGSFGEIRPPFETAELEEMRLAMNRMSGRLERSDKARKSFFGNVSHELRNPLMSIGGYAQGIEQGIFPEPERAAHTILEESARLTELVDELLNLSRLEADDSAAALEPISPADALADAFDRVAGLALRRGISLKTAPEACDVSILGSEELLANILDNLLSNAIRYAKTAVTASISAGDGKVFVTVADDGDGIDEDILPRVFERGCKGSGGNFGLGLAIAQSSAGKMRGTIRAENSAAGGAVFTVTFDTTAKAEA